MNDWFLRLVAVCANKSRFSVVPTVGVGYTGAGLRNITRTPKGWLGWSPLGFGAIGRNADTGLGSCRFTCTVLAKK